MDTFENADPAEIHAHGYGASISYASISYFARR